MDDITRTLWRGKPEGYEMILYWGAISYLRIWMFFKAQGLKMEKGSISYLGVTIKRKGLGNGLKKIELIKE